MTYTKPYTMKYTMPHTITYTMPYTMTTKRDSRDYVSHSKINLRENSFKK